MAKAKSKHYGVRSATLHSLKCIWLKGLNKKHFSPLQHDLLCPYKAQHLPESIQLPLEQQDNKQAQTVGQFFRGVPKDKKTNLVLLSRGSLAACIALKNDCEQKFLCAHWPRTGFDFPYFLAPFSNHHHFFKEIFPFASSRKCLRCCQSSYSS